VGEWFEDWFDKDYAAVYGHRDQREAEAAVLEAQGDPEGAMEKLAETEATILAFPKNAQRETLLRLLQRWRSELGKGDGREWH